MHEQKQIVLIQESDRQVLKGLVLLLEDMQFQVYPALQGDELERLVMTLNHCPSLLILPIEPGSEIDSIKRVRRLRLQFNQTIPTIFLNNHGINLTEQFIDKNIFIMSNNFKPDELRRCIYHILDSALLI
ncbi:MAG: hypothetical protein OEY52_09100 [Gammaproteobacteria bacterium]|nr:hypothetical protein [Gammaproteobacteria bacterium]